MHAGGRGGFARTVSNGGWAELGGTRRCEMVGDWAVKKKCGQPGQGREYAGMAWRAQGCAGSPG